MDKSEFLDYMGKILEADAGSLSDDRPIDPIRWDSIELLGTVELLDKVGVAANFDDIQSCRSIGEILRLAGY